MLLAAERDRDQRAAQLRTVERLLPAADSAEGMIETAVSSAVRLLPDRAESRVSFIEQADAADGLGVVVASAGRDAEAVRRTSVPVWAGLSSALEPSSSYDSPPIDLPFGAEVEVLVYRAPVVQGDMVRGSLVATATSPLRRGDLDMIDRLASELGEALNVRKLSDELYRQRAERRFKTLVENSSDIVMVLDAHDQIAFVSPAIQPVLGRREDDLVGTGLRLLAEGEHRVTVDRFLHATRAGTSLKPIEVRIRRADGVLALVRAARARPLGQRGDRRAGGDRP